MRVLVSFSTHYLEIMTQGGWIILALQCILYSKLVYSLASNAKQHYISAEDGHKICVYEKGSPSTCTHSILLLHGRSFSSKPVFDLVFSSSASSSTKNSVSEVTNLSVMDKLAECNVSGRMSIVLILISIDN